jgi:hypothetical protein
MSIDRTKWKLLLAPIGIALIGVILRVINKGDAILFKIFYWFGFSAIVFGSVAFAYVATLFILDRFGVIEIEGGEDEDSGVL